MIAAVGSIVEQPVAIEVAELTLRYGAREALSQVSLAIPAGQVTAVVGPSGSGKSSFLMCLNRLIDLVPGAQATGSVRVGTLNVFSPGVDIRALRRRMGMIFQHPNPFALSIRENLLLPQWEHRPGSAAAHDAALEKALRDVGLWGEVSDRLDQSALKLSGGQQQRLCLARALVLEPEVLLLDEPCSSLDPLAAEIVEGLIAQLRGRYTIVVVTHNLAQAKRLADHVALFWTQDERGRLLESGPASQLFESPQHPLAASYFEGRVG